MTDAAPPTAADLRRWRKHLANERAEAAVYRDLAQKHEGEEREILAAIAAAEERHEQHWLNLLGDDVGQPGRADLGTRMLAFMARHFGSVFVLALVQRFEARASYDDDADATPTMAADEQIHEEVIRALAARGRDRLSGSFRAAVFGANDGLVSNLALILGVAASGVSNHTILVTGLAGLLAGALSMGAGEYVSVSSQRELLEASGARDVRARTDGPSTVGNANHEMGTARMGRDPKTSVLNAHNQAWEVPNLFVTDGGEYPITPRGEGAVVSLDAGGQEAAHLRLGHLGQEGHLAAMKAHLWLGRPEASIKQYEHCKKLLARELQIVETASLNDLDLDRLNEFIASLNRQVRIETLKPTIEAALPFLVKRGFVRDDKVTTLGLLVCGQSPERWLNFRCQVHGYVIGNL